MTKKDTKLEVVKDDVKVEKPLNKPTPEEIEQFKKDFQDAIEEFDDRKWEISDPGNFPANDVGIYLLNFMKKFAFWSKSEWMGMIKMEEEIKKAIVGANEETGFELKYQALEFCAYMLANPGGTGLKLAKEFEAQADKYAKIGIVVGTKIEEAREQLKDIQFLQDRYAAGEQGFYYEKEPTEGMPEDAKPIEDVTAEIKDQVPNESVD